MTCIENNVQECGDGIMSAIDMFGNVDIIKGKGGEARVTVQLNGKVSIVLLQYILCNCTNHSNLAYNIVQKVVHGVEGAYTCAVTGGVLIDLWMRYLN